MTHQALAAHVHKHPVHVAKAFRKAYGETIGDCQRRFRLEKARHLLCKGGMPLAEVALECGFANQASRAVRNVGTAVLWRFPRAVGRVGRFIVPRFPSARHFHRFGRRDDFYRARRRLV